MSDLDPVLRAIEEVRDEGRERAVKADADRKEFVSRLDLHDEKIAQHGAALTTLGTEVASHTSQLAKLADSQISVARSSSIAAELAAQALSKVNTAQDETRKMVESAMSIQSDAISGAVVVALKPVVKEIESLKKNDTAQNEQFALIVSLLHKLARWQDHWTIKVLLIAAVAVGGVLAGYLSAPHLPVLPHVTEKAPQ